MFTNTKEEHDQFLKTVLHARLVCKKNIPWNRAKCDFNMNAVEFFGYHFSADAGMIREVTKFDTLAKDTCIMTS